MNATSKPSNNGALANLGSFVAAPVNSIKNAASTVANSAKNSANTVASSFKSMFNGNTLSDISEPITESINGSFESDTSPFISIPVIIGLGILIVLFIIFIMFRQQITYALENAWYKLKEMFGYKSKASSEEDHDESHCGGTCEKHNKKHHGKHHGKPHENSHGMHPAVAAESGSVIEKILPGKNQVFNIAQDKYTYSDAEPLCKAFGAELATYDQVKEAWKQGADWCNYGWVKGQSAIYPTQEATYKKLQAGPEDQRGACGVTGINGGYFDNPEMRFGVNCYGPKPAESDSDIRHTMAKNSNLTPDALAYDKKVQDYKAHMSETPVNPFSTGTWSA